VHLTKICKIEITYCSSERWRRRKANRWW